MKIPTPDERPTLTVEETAEILGLSRWHVYEQVKKGALPSLHLGRRVLIPTGRLRQVLGLDEVTGGNLSVPRADRQTDDYILLVHRVDDAKMAAVRRLLDGGDS